MKGQAQILVTKGEDGRSRFRQLRSCAALALRRCGNTIYLVSGAANPIGGDDLSLQVEVGPGASLEIRGVGAALARPDPAGRWSHSRVAVTLAEGASLLWSPPSGISAKNSRHRSQVEISVATGASLWWHEGVVLGRVGEPSGLWQSSFTVARNGRTIFRQANTLGDPAGGLEGPAVTGGAHVIATVLGIGVIPDAAGIGVPSSDRMARTLDEPDAKATAMTLATGTDIVATALAQSEPDARRLASSAAAMLLESTSSTFRSVHGITCDRPEWDKSLT